MDLKVCKDEYIHTGEEISRRLQNELPHWYIENGSIQRKYNTTGWNGTLLVINTVAHLAETALHDPDLKASYSFVIVKLRSHSVKGVTNKDFELARDIEDVVMWHPVEQGAISEETPGDSRFGASSKERRFNSFSHIA